MQEQIANRFEKIRLCNEKLSARLLQMIGSEPPSRVEHRRRVSHAIVAHIEINDHHGVGVLLKRLFGGTGDTISIRSQDYYGGRQDFGSTNVRISHAGGSRDMVFWNVLEAVGSADLRRVLAAPYFADDALTAIALTEAYGAPLCTFLMDDRNLCSDGISDDVMNDLLEKSSLRLAISPQMCAGYEAKYGCKFWFMPPVAPARLIPTELNQIPKQTLREGQPIILGNIWGQRWLEGLRGAVRGTGVSLRWYNNGEFRWLSCTKEELARDGILPQEGPPDPDETLVETLRRAPYVVVPSGTLEEDDDRRFIAQLSFPSRIPFILATSHAPILVLGSPETAAARIVTRLGIGMAARYGREEFLEAAAQITRPEVNLKMRRAAFLLSERFSDRGAAEWIWQSLEKGEPADRRYEDLMLDLRPDTSAVLAGLQKRASWN
jgi:hypothetical protein